MKFENKELEASFTLPDAITVRQQMKYASARDEPSLKGDDISLYERLWPAAQIVIQEWQCKDVPLDVNIDAVTDKRVTEVIRWVSLAVFTYMVNLGQVPKND